MPRDRARQHLQSVPHASPPHQSSGFLARSHFDQRGAQPTKTSTHKVQRSRKHSSSMSPKRGSQSHTKERERERESADRDRDASSTPEADIASGGGATKGASSRESAHPPTYRRHITPILAQTQRRRVRTHASRSTGRSGRFGGAAPGSWGPHSSCRVLRRLSWYSPGALCLTKHRSAPEETTLSAPSAPEKFPHQRLRRKWSTATALRSKEDLTHVVDKLDKSSIEHQLGAGAKNERNKDKGGCWKCGETVLNCCRMHKASGQRQKMLRCRLLVALRKSRQVAATRNPDMQAMSGLG